MRSSAAPILWLVYFLCLIPALVTLTHRIQFDQGFRSTALVADYVQLVELAQTENVPIEDVLQQVRDVAGVTRLALLEDTPQFLAQRGLCTIVEGVGWPGWLTPEEREEIEKNHGREPEEATPPDVNWPLLMDLPHDMTHLIFSDPIVFQRIAHEAQARYQGLIRITDNGVDGGIVSLAGEPKIILEWGMGFDPNLAAALKLQGFAIYPRLRDYAGYTAETIDRILRQTTLMFPSGWIIFDGDSIIGSHGHLPTVSGTLKELSQTAWTGGVGWVEFAEQVGAHSLARGIPSATARVHSIEDEEMEVITSERAVARYLRAVRERAVRIVYLKPFLLATDQTNRIDKSIAMFTRVREALESRGFVLGEPSRIDSPVKSNLITRIAAVIALVVGLSLLIYLAAGRFSIALTSAIAILVFVIFFGAGNYGLKAVLLGLAVTSPTLALAWLVRKFEDIEKEQKLVAPIAKAIGLWVGAVIIILTGGLLISAGLINQMTLLEIDAFSGVKLALYLPILFALLLGVQVILPPENRTLTSAISWLLGVPVRVWHVLLGFVALVGLFIMLDRSGNFPVINVADWESNIRGWLETALYARPRTKEAFIGHPALILGLVLGLSRLGIRRPLMFAGLVIGSIALTSLTNTFCHVHTPFELSVYRTLAGALIGLILGLIAGLVVLGLTRMMKVKVRD